MAKLLIIDDESDIREFAQNYFKKRGIETLTASDGREGLDIISANKPDLVVLDMRMDGMSGLEVLQELKTKNIPIKVIVASGAEDAEVGPQVQPFNIVELVHKPLNLAALEKIVMRELGGSAQ